MFITVLTLLLSNTASAAGSSPVAQPEPNRAVYGDEHSETEDFAGNIYVQGRGSIAMPADLIGVATPTSLGVGARWDDGTRLGIRGMVMPNPPEVFYADPGPIGGGLVVDYAHHFPVTRNTSIYPIMSAGVLLAVDERDNRNVVLPVSEAGVGLEFAAPTRNGNYMTLSPEIGVVPFMLAPYAALNVGVLFDGD